MESDFLHAIDMAVDEALPADWPRVPRERLPVRGVLRARDGFQLRDRSGPGSYLVIVAVPPQCQEASVRDELAALVEHVLARGASLLLLYDSRDDPDEWIEDHLSGPHPRLLTLGCTVRNATAAPQAAPPAAAQTALAPSPTEPAPAAPVADTGVVYLVEPTARGLEPLAGALRDLWSGALFYEGPREGLQIVGVEVMQDGCRRCQMTLGTVTGIVFPDRQVADWSSPDWTYFQQLVEVAVIGDPVISALAAAVDAWRAAGDTALTPLRWHRGEDAGESGWMAECPACGACRGAFSTMASRMRLLHDLESRRSGALRYRPLQLEIPRQLLWDLAWCWEISAHARSYGWTRTPGAPPRHGGASGGAADVSYIAEPGAPAITHPPPTPSPQPGQGSALQAAGPWQRLGQALASWLAPRRGS